jgi:NADH-quinone oxidoreductase subunit L
MIQLAWLIPVLPLIGFLINGIGNKRIPKKLVGIIGSTTVFFAFVISCGIFLELRSSEIKSFTIFLFDWINIGSLNIPFSFLIDPLSVIMLLVVTGVGFLIHVYSSGYMFHDEDFARFFAYLNLFMFSMLLLVLGNNYLIMFIGWEGVGLCSYLLIGFWFSNHHYNDAAKKAFVMNRIGDLGFLLGMFLIFNTFGSLTYSDVFANANNYGSGEPVILAITLLLFVGATGKSAQIPLFTWLPDAMAGPTPVSALIHAATMVTAGIYMIVRSNILFALAPVTLNVSAVIGILTALIAAVIALTQTDIKKVLAYSTVSQLGYMFLALGVGAFGAGMFHVITHAFFKALLFLGAGSVIHAMHHEQDITKMGGLRKKLPVTFITFLVATIAIAGIPPFSGFFSKDEILAHAFNKSPLLWALALMGALLTAFYMFRLLYLTFYGKFRGTHHQEEHLHESPKSMTIPLMVLAVLSFAGGFIGLPEAFHLPHALNHFLEPVLASSALRLPVFELSHKTEYILMGSSVVLVILSILYARMRYVTKNSLPPANIQEQGFLFKLSYNKFYVDEFYNFLISKPLLWLSKQSYRFLEISFIDGIVNGVGKLVVFSGNKLRYLQTGNITFYVFAMVIGMILLFLVNIIY